MIELEKINFIYNKTNNKTLNNIDLKVEEGEFVLVCGTSGSGKTSLTRVINKLIPDYYCGDFEGDIKIKGSSIVKRNIFEISKFIGSVFQNPRTQFFNVDTNSEIVFGLENQGILREKLKQRLVEVAVDLEIVYLLNRNIFKLSGGEKQKIAFASVYAMNPDIYLLDEPSSNLDISSIDELKKYLKFLKKEGKTIIISEHRIYYLIDLVDKIIYMKDGEIKKIYIREDFLSLSDNKIKEMGLRSRTKTNIKIKVNTNSPTPSLQIKNLSLFRKDTCILKNIDFTAEKGDIIAVIGPNGIGKTTFLRALSGLYEYYKGEIFFESKKLDIKQRIKKSYMLMQDVNYQLFADSVFAECKLGIRGAEDNLIEEILSDFDLIKYKHKHPNTLSGGQKQRLAIAVGLICNKEILILDEPTSGLDYKNMLVTVRLLKKYSNDRIIFISTHDYEFANLVCNKVLNLEENKGYNF